jgi:hypothetical protein
MTPEELKEFDEASEHHEKCKCDKCLKWWAIMGEEE